MIIGITGPIASGKNILTNMFIEKGFVRLSLSEEVREEVRKRGLNVERTVLQDVGNEMRKKHGNSYWARRLVAKVEKGKHYVIEGIRNPGEIEELRKQRNFVLLGVDAPIEKRLDWILKRNKASDPKTLEGIRAMDARDRGIGEDEHGQQSQACFDMADDYIVNDSDLEELKEKVASLVDQLVG